MAVKALVEAGAFAERFPVADVALLAGADVGAGRVEAGSIRMAVVLTESAFIDVGTCGVGPLPGRLARIRRHGRRWNFAQESRTIA